MTVKQPNFTFASLAIVFAESACLSHQNLDKDQALETSNSYDSLCEIKGEMIAKEKGYLEKSGYSCGEKEDFEIKSNGDSIIRAFKIVCHQKGQINMMLVPAVEKASDSTCYTMTQVIRKKDTATLINTLPINND